jgi:hypothetical protein
MDVARSLINPVVLKRKKGSRLICFKKNHRKCTCIEKATRRRARSGGEGSMFAGIAQANDGR